MKFYKRWVREREREREREERGGSKCVGCFIRCDKRKKALGTKMNEMKREEEKREREKKETET